MRFTRFKLNYELPTLNQYIKIERGNKFASAALKKKHTNNVALLAKSASIELDNDVRYDVAITWYVHNLKSDPDNIAFGVKFIFDGLVKAKILANDGHKNIGSIHHHFELDKSNDYTHSIIEFIPEIIGKPF